MNSSSLRRPWQAPLVPLALAATAGIVLDRYLSWPLALSLVLLGAGLGGWIVAQNDRSGLWPLLVLCVAVMAIGAARHQEFRNLRRPDDIGRLATTEPQLIRLRGILAEEPRTSPGKGDSKLRSMAPTPFAQVLLRATSVQQGTSWREVSGQVRLTVPGTLTDYHVGDEVEVVGSLMAPVSPGNPGEFDRISQQKDAAIGGVLHVRHSAEVVRRIGDGWPWTVARGLALIQKYCEDAIDERISEPRRNVARALLLGEESAMDQADWDRYQRTGVVHVLAVSGQHLVVLAYFLGMLLRTLHIGRRRSTAILSAILFGYGLLTGGQSPVMRAVVMVCALNLGLWLRRVVLPVNSFALAWLLICLWHPPSLFNAGCQLSFLAVAVLYWGVRSFARKEPDPLNQLLDEQRPRWHKVIRHWAGEMAIAYGVTLAVWLVVSPLVAARFHMVCPVALLIGPPVVVLASLALLSGFLMLLLSPLGPVSQVLAWITDLSLAACEGLVGWAEHWPGAYMYVPDVPQWWLWCFYLLLLAGLILPELRRRWLWVGLALLAWLCFGLTVGLMRPGPDGLRCTFLDVGHGGCIVLETADGRTLLYDAGSISGPELTRRFIAPYLWSRGIRRIDEVFLSHADLDHFNGLADLIERFAVGQVSCTPTFADRKTAGVAYTLDALKKHGIPLRIIRAGDRHSAGDVQIQVLHPPTVGPEGKENVRSLVLLIQHLDHALLLTGDLEDVGQKQVLSMPPVLVDVLHAPHHGSLAANKEDLAKWARPKVVVSCQERPKDEIDEETNAYLKLGATYLTTWEHGAVTIHSGPAGLTVETYRSKQRWQVR